VRPLCFQASHIAMQDCCESWDPLMHTTRPAHRHLSPSLAVRDQRPWATNRRDRAHSRPHRNFQLGAHRSIPPSRERAHCNMIGPLRLEYYWQLDRNRIAEGRRMHRYTYSRHALGADPLQENRRQLLGIVVIPCAKIVNAPLPTDLLFDDAPFGSRGSNREVP